MDDCKRLDEAVNISITSVSFRLVPTGDHPVAVASIVFNDAQGQAVEVLAASVEFEEEQNADGTTHKICVAGSGISLEVADSRMRSILANSMPDVKNAKDTLGQARGFELATSALMCLESLGECVEATPDVWKGFAASDAETEFVIPRLPDTSDNGWVVDSPRVTVRRYVG